MKKYFLLIVLFFLISCGTTQNKGYLLSDYNVYDNVKVGITYKGNVINLLGEPSFKINEDAYLYYSYSKNKYGISSKRAINEKILIIIFDENGFTKEKIYKENEISNFVMNPKVIKFHEKDENFFKEMVKGLDLNLLN